MLYALSKSEMERLRQIDFPLFEYPGAEMLSALFRTDPDIVQTILPKPLIPADEPLGWAFVARYPETNFGLSSYNEGALFVRALYKGEPGWYCLALPVDNDMAMAAGRETSGFPKKMAEEITLGRTNNHVMGSVIRRGVEILHIEAELSGPVSSTSLDAVGPEVDDLEGNPCRKFVAFTFKAFHRQSGGFDYLPRLGRDVLLLRPRDEIRSGAGKLEMVSSPYDPLGDIPVRELIDVSYGIFDNQQLPGRVVARVKNPFGFMRYAGFKMDFLAWFLAQDDMPKRPERSERRQRQKAIKQY
jgi:acetoacetate decarboxylase